MSYSSQIGRWLESDPSQYVDGPNLYQMEKSNPVTGLDPTGRNDVLESPDASGACSSSTRPAVATTAPSTQPVETKQPDDTFGRVFSGPKHKLVERSFDGDAPMASSSEHHDALGTGGGGPKHGGGGNSSTLPPPSTLSGVTLANGSAGSTVAGTGTFTGTRGSSQGYQSISLD